MTKRKQKEGYANAQRMEFGDGEKIVTKEVIADQKL